MNNSFASLKSHAQCQAIEATLGELLNGKARVWLSRPYYPLPGEGEMELLPTAPAPDLVQRARLEEKLICASGEITINRKLPVR